MNRKKDIPKEFKPVSIGIGLPEWTIDAIDKEAHDSGQSRSAWIRYVMIGHMIQMGYLPPDKKGK